MIQAKRDYKAKRDVWVWFEDTNTMERAEMKSLEPGDIIALEDAPGYWEVVQWPCLTSEGVWSVMVKEEVR